MFSWVTLQHLQKWTSAKIAGALPEARVTGISTDTRTIRPGEVFLAIKGENFDGHDYVSQAADKGALAVIAERAPSGLGAPVLLVPDSLHAFAAIAAEIRCEVPGPVVAITGSAGKSSTKEMTATLLGPGTVASPASFNNLLGVSKTLCLADDRTERMVLEMGMNAVGEIAEMCRYFKPVAGLITNIGDAHVGKVGGHEKVYQAKRELFEGIAARGRAALGVALNRDDERVRRAFQETFPDGTRVVPYGVGGAAAKGQVTVTRHVIDPDTGFLSLALKFDTGEEEAIGLPFFGLHHAQNVAASVALVRLLGVTVADVKRRLAALRPAPHRGEVLRLSGDRMLIDESYNSNPTALASSLRSLSALDPRRRLVLVIGDMRELEEFGERLHRESGERLAESLRGRSGPVVVVGVGTLVTHLLEAAKTALPGVTTHRTENVDEATSLLRHLLREGDRIFVKSSRGGRLDKLVDALQSI